MVLFDKCIAVLKQHRQYSPALDARLEAMQRRPVLGKEELHDLIFQISVGRYAGKQLFGKQYADEVEKQQLLKIVAIGEEAVRVILDCGWIFILPVMIEYLSPVHQFDALWEVGCTALHRALVTYHHLPGCQFNDYVNVWIQQLIEESFQDNSVYVPSLRLLAAHQSKLEDKLNHQLQRSATVEEVALATRYLSVHCKNEILSARELQKPLSTANDYCLRLAITKTILVRHYLELSKEFTMELTVTVEGSCYCFNSVVRIEQALAQEVKELLRCGVSHFGGQDDLIPSDKPWNCRHCKQEQRFEGCGRWQEVTSLRKHPEQICLWLDDGRKFFVEDDFWTIVRQLSSSLNARP